MSGFNVGGTNGAAGVGALGGVDDGITQASFNMFEIAVSLARLKRDSAVRVGEYALESKKLGREMIACAHERQVEAIHASADEQKTAAIFNLAGGVVQSATGIFSASGKAYRGLRTDRLQKAAGTSAAGDVLAQTTNSSGTDGVFAIGNTNKPKKAKKTGSAGSAVTSSNTSAADGAHAINGNTRGARAQAPGIDAATKNINTSPTDTAPTPNSKKKKAAERADEAAKKDASAADKTAQQSSADEQGRFGKLLDGAGDLSETLSSLGASASHIAGAAGTLHTQDAIADAEAEKSAAETQQQFGMQELQFASEIDSRAQAYYNELQELMRELTGAINSASNYVKV